MAATARRLGLPALLAGAAILAAAAVGLLLFGGRSDADRGSSDAAPAIRLTPAPPVAEDPAGDTPTEDQGGLASSVFGGDPEAAIEAALEQIDRTAVRVYGVVRDERARPASADLVVRVAGSTDPLAHAHAHQGVYAIGDLDAASCLLVCSALGYRSVEVPVTLGPVALRMDFDLLPLPLIQVEAVTPEGDPFLRAARAAAGISENDIFARLGQDPDWREDGPPVRVAGVPSGAGIFRSRRWLAKQGRKPGPQVIGALQPLADPPLYAGIVVDGEIRQTLRLDAVPETLRFIVPVDELKASRAAVVFDLEAGAGVVAREAWIRIDDALHYADRIPRDSEGRLTLVGLEGGQRVLRAGGGGAATIQRAILLISGRTNDLGVVKLQGAVSIAGTVRAPEGHDARSRIQVIPVEVEGLSPDDRAGYWTSSDPAGAFEIRDIPPGRYALYASRILDTFSRNTLLGLAGGSGILDATEPLTGASVTMSDAGYPWWDAAAAANGGFVVIKDTRGVPVWCHPQGAVGPLALLAPGRYTITVEDAEGAPKTAAFDYTIGSAIPWPR